MRLALAGSGPLADSQLVRQLVRLSIESLKPKTIVVLPGHKRFNALVRSIAEGVGLPVEEMQPPRPTWVSEGLQSLRKRIVRGFYAKQVAKNVDMVFAFKQEGRSGACISQLLEEAPEAVVCTVRADGNSLA